MSFDSAEELHKIKRIYPKAQLLLRFKTCDVDSKIPLGNKYGADLADCPALLKTAAQLQLSVVGAWFVYFILCFVNCLSLVMIAFV